MISASTFVSQRRRIRSAQLTPPVLFGEARSVKLIATLTSFRRACLLLVLVALAAPARADEDAKALFDQGTALFALHRFAESAAAYEKAFALHPDPALLYNAAQAQRLAGNKRRARDLYESLLRVYGDRIDNRVEITTRIRELDAALAAEPPPSSSPVTPAAVTTPHADAGAIVRGRERLAGVVLLAAGVALVATGGALTGVAVHDNDVLSHPPSDWVFDANVARQRDSFYPAGLALLGLGTASLAAGVGALVLGLRTPRALRVDVANAQSGVVLAF
jgi:tetratricopeptide (TPR) repeat protein